MPRIARTDLDVFPLCLGGSVFGWTADEDRSIDVLDAYAEAGGNFIDTADSYMAVIPGNRGGESETIIGNWLRRRGDRERMVIATKVGMLPGLTGLSARTIRTAAEQSLRRLGTDYIDLYYAHIDDPDTPLEESLAAFEELVRAGLVRYVAASNFSAARLDSALAVARVGGLEPFRAVQPEYNLMERAGYEAELAGLVAARDLAVVPYFALAKGFLTGKYRSGRVAGTARANAPLALLNDVHRYHTEHGAAVLSTVDDVARRRGTTCAAISLAWLRTRPGVVAPVASARTVDQLRALLPSAAITLSAREIAALDAVSDWRAGHNPGQTPAA